MQRLLNTLFFLLLLLSAATLPASAATSRLFGDVTLEMANYRAEEAGAEVEKVTSMRQQYTLGIEKKGVLGDNRLGSYTLLLGYEFNVVDVERYDQGVRDATFGKIDTDKIYYNANIHLAPGGLPFRLHLFAKDLTRSTLGSRNFSNLRLGNQSQSRFSGHLVDAEVPTDLINGTHQVYGATLLLGIRNGSYLGQYRDVLSHLPRLLIDYKQEDVKDLHNVISQTHYRHRDLAFVSLNKLDNWVHVRMRDYINFLNEEDNSSTAQVMIGTIDHNLNRQWINLTNWIKISGELSLTTEEEKYWPDPRVTYNTNLFAVANRDDIQANILSSFERINDGSLITSKLDVPIVVNFERNRDTLIRTRLITEMMQSTPVEGIALSPLDDGGGYTSEDTRMYLDLSADLQRTRAIKIKPRFEIETFSDANAKSGVALRLGGEFASNTALRKSLSWLAGYSLTNIQTKDGSASDNYLQNDFYGQVDQDVNSTLRIGGRSLLQVSTGDDDNAVGFRIPTIASAVSRNSLGVDEDNGDLKTNANFSLYLDHRYRQMGNRLELEVNSTTGLGDSITNSILRHSLRYQKMVHSVEWDSVLAVGDEAQLPSSVNLEFVEKDVTIDEKNSRTSWSSRSTYRYNPSRSTALTLLGSISEAQNLSYQFSEELVYRLFTTNGIVRRIAEFSELIRYEKVARSVGNRDASLYGLFSAAYLPTKYLECKVSSELVSFIGSGALQQTHSAEVAFGFEKLKILASFSKGQKDRESDELPEVMEERWDVKVKKIF